MTLILAILGAIPAIYGILKFFEKFEKTPAEKAIDAIAETEFAIDKSKSKGDTSAIEDLINN